MPFGREVLEINTFLGVHIFLGLCTFIGLHIVLGVHIFQGLGLRWGGQFPILPPCLPRKIP